jgi:hypothetical protein
MTTPTPEQLARLREIALRTALDNARKTNAASVNQRWMFDEYINEQSVAILESLLTVWREAQGEKHQLEASLRLAVEALGKITCQCDYLKRLQVESICFRCRTLSTIRANHPGLFPVEPKTPQSQ